MSETAHLDHSEKKAFLVNSSSLKEVRNFCREVFEKLQIQQELKDELVLAIAEAAQNIVKHAFKNSADANELMVVQISCEITSFKLHFMIEAHLLIQRKLNTEKLIMLSLGA